MLYFIEQFLNGIQLGMLLFLLAEITNWYKVDRTHFMADAQIDEWVSTTRHKVIYRDAQNVD